VVVLDTNVLLLAAQRGFPFEAEVGRLVPGARIVVPSSALRELDSLVARRTAGSVVARAIADRYEIGATARSGDDGVVEVATRARGVVATADRALQRRLIDRGVGVLVPRDRARLELRPAAVRQRLRSAPRSMRSKAV
jgi:rRNA-processing protein FCF1